MAPRDDELINLIARCALRDQGALKALFDRLGGYLHGVGYRILQSRELSDDALQDTFVQIWDNAASYRPDKAKPLTWLTSIMRYRALDRRDRELKHQRRRDFLSDEEQAAVQHTEQTPEQWVAHAQERSQIERCLEALSQGMRQCIALAYLEGYSREELAQRLDTNINTVKSWLRRGSERLRRCLQATIETN